MQHTKQTRTTAKAKQGGFIQGAILFGLAVLVAVIGAFALANNGSSSSADKETDKVNAGVILKQGSDLRDAASRYLSDGNAIGSLAFTNASLFDPAKGYGSAPSAPARVFSATQNAYVLDAGTTAVSGQGTTAADYTATLIGLTQGVCERINNTLYNTPMLDDAVTGALSDGKAGGSTVANQKTGVSEGCFKEATNGYTYFKVLVAK